MEQVAPGGARKFWLFLTSRRQGPCLPAASETDRRAPESTAPATPRTSRVALGGSPDPIRGDGDAGKLRETISVALSTPHRLHQVVAGERACRHPGVPRAGLGSPGLTKRPGLQWFPRHHSGGLGEAGQGRAMPRFIHQSHGLLALGHGLICPAQHGWGGGRASWGGTLPGDWTWNRPGSRARSPEPHQVGDSRKGSECPCRQAAGCPPLSCTMSDGEGPSAGEWQCYIYPLQVPLQSQGHRSPRAPPPPPQAAGSCGAGPPSS